VNRIIIILHLVEEAFMSKRIVIGISGASGVPDGVRMLELLRETEFETHLIISKAGRLNIEIETSYKPAEVEAMMDFDYDHILPPVPSFYHQPKTIEDIIDQTIGIETG
jgi:3-polyprenyl-4-hydroxybenzoate decarboxylase